MNKIITLDQKVLLGVSGGICFAYKSSHYCKTKQGIHKDNCLGHEGDTSLRTCKERVCSNPENKSWEYSDAFTRGGAKEPNAKGKCGSDKIKYTGKSFFKIEL